MSFLRSVGIFFMAVAISAQIPPSAISAPPDVASVPADATKTASGLATRVLTPGTGKDHPTKDEIVVVNYTGWTAEGKMFDGSAARGKPSTLAVNRVLLGLGVVKLGRCDVHRNPDLLARFVAGLLGRFENEVDGRRVVG